LKDTHGAVRKQVAWALGAIGDGRAADGLTAALQDTDADVRKQAAWALGAVVRRQ
jgi:HEAT repeat protein